LKLCEKGGVSLEGSENGKKSDELSKLDDVINEIMPMAEKWSIFNSSPLIQNHLDLNKRTSSFFSRPSETS